MHNEKSSDFSTLLLILIFLTWYLAMTLNDMYVYVLAFLDYNDIPYKIVEVNPISKKEIKWSAYKKVPILMVDGEQMVDSSGIEFTELALISCSKHLYYVIDLSLCSYNGYADPKDLFSLIAFFM